MLSSDKLVQRKFDWKKEYKPEEGMLGTLYSGSDSYVVVCLGVISPKRVLVGSLDIEDTENNPNIIISAADGVQHLKDLSYKGIYDKEKYSQRKDGTWRSMDSVNQTSWIHWGYGRYYRDPNF